MTATLDILDRLIRFDTVSSKSNISLIQFVQTYLMERGFRVELIPDDDAAKSGLYAEIGPAGEGVLLSAHTDVVPTDGQTWTKDPFRLTREDGRVYGRGTTDMKGFVASVMALADRAAQAELKEPIKIALSYDEEVGCVGIQKMLDRLAPMIGHPRACIVGEPTEMTVAVGHKGKAALKAVCYGQSGHSALAPNFVNALYLATDFVSGLNQLQVEYRHSGARDTAYSIPYTTIHVGKLSGGTVLNIVPDRAELIFEYRHLSADRAVDILAQIESAARRVEASYTPLWSGARIEVTQYNAYPGLDVSERSSAVTLAQKLVQRNDTTKVAFGTEAGFFDELGIPTIVCGPGSMADQGHKPDEYVTLDQLTACDAMMDRILAELRV